MRLLVTRSPSRLVSLLLLSSCLDALAIISSASTVTASVSAALATSSVSSSDPATVAVAFASGTVANTPLASATALTTPSNSSSSTTIIPTATASSSLSASLSSPTTDLTTLCAGRTAQLTCLDSTRYTYCHLTDLLTSPDPSITCTNDQLSLSSTLTMSQTPDQQAAKISAAASQPSLDPIPVHIDPHNKSATTTILRTDPVNGGRWNGRFHVCGAEDTANPCVASGGLSAADWSNNHLTCLGGVTYTYCENLDGQNAAPAYNLPAGKKCDPASGTLAPK